MKMDHKPAASSAGSSGAGATILDFKQRTSIRKRSGSPINHPLRRYDEEEDRMRMRENLAAAAIVILLITSGLWLIDHLRASARIEVCVEAGHRNCMPLDPTPVQSR
jgi:hypothetical protein